ncbi:MAG: hypothetical protein M3O50_08705 [Myxococcota bacterium]|nr:hypothetical protein [Myxococcota bacterium]
MHTIARENRGRLWSLPWPSSSIALVNAVRLDQRTAEQLPNARHRFAVTSRVAHRFASSTVRLDERAYADI